MSSLTPLQYKSHSIKDSQSILDTPAKITLEKWGGRNPSFYNYDRSFLDALSTKLKVFTGSPEVKIFNDVIYMPQYSCLYSSDGLRINYSCSYSGPERKLDKIATRIINSPDHITPPDQITPPKQLKKISQKFIYAGKVNKHYGSFLTRAIARLWYLVKDRQYPVLLHEKNGLQKTFIDLFFESAKLDKNRFISFKEPVLLKEVIIPYPSFSIRCEGFEVHKLLPESVAKNLLPEKIKTTSQPLYLSRRYLNQNKRLIINESKLEEKLSESGFAIVSPEKLSLKQQIELINKHEVIVGAQGSALHSILFDISSQRNLVCFGNQESMKTTYLIIDAIKSVNSIYISALQKDPNCFKKRSKQNQLIDLDIAINGLRKFGLI